MSDDNIGLRAEQIVEEADGVFLKRAEYDALLKEVEELKTQLNAAQEDLRIISETQGFYSSLQDSPSCRRARRYFQSVSRVFEV